MRLLHHESNYHEMDTHIRSRQRVFFLSFTCTYPKHAHTDTRVRVLSDGRCPRAVVMLGCLFISPSLSSLASISPPNLSLCCHAPVNTPPVTFKGLNLCPGLSSYFSVLFFSLSSVHGQPTTSHRGGSLFSTYPHWSRLQGDYTNIDAHYSVCTSA